jgi:hypothetical protein
MTTNNAINCRAAGQIYYDGAGTFAASTLTQHSTLVGGAANAIVSLGVATNGQLVVGSTGAQPVLATLTAGGGIGITNAAGSITIASTGGGLAWTDVAGIAQAMAVNSGYTANNAGLVTLTLPASAVYGSVFKVVGKGAGLWKIAQNAGQTIHFGSVNTTAGVGGSLAATFQYDAIELVTTVVDTEFTVQSSIGNITYV